MPEAYIGFREDIGDWRPILEELEKADEIDFRVCDPSVSYMYEQCEGLTGVKPQVVVWIQFYGDEGFKIFDQFLKVTPTDITFFCDLAYVVRRNSQIFVDPENMRTWGEDALEYLTVPYTYERMKGHGEYYYDVLNPTSKEWEMGPP